MSDRAKNAFPKIVAKTAPSAQSRAPALETVIANGATKTSPAKLSPRTVNTSDEVTVTTEFWLEIVNQAEKSAPFWGYLGDPRSADFGARCVACLNAAHWPTAAALERKDWRAIKWFIAAAL